MSAVGDKMGPSERRLNDSQIPYRTLLSILTALFAFRVLMQPLVWKWPIKMLPSFDQWHSEAMPYGVLLFLQLIILGLMILGCFKIPNLGTNQIVSRILLVLGWLYAVAMVSRLIIGLFELSPKLWFKGAVPTTFHFVLLSYIMILSYILSEKKSKKARFSLSRYFGYPVLIVGTYLHFVWMKHDKVASFWVEIRSKEISAGSLRMSQQNTYSKLAMCPENRKDKKRSNSEPKNQSLWKKQIATPENIA